jgi:hypothetical protein
MKNLLPPLLTTALFLLGTGDIHAAPAAPKWQDLGFYPNAKLNSLQSSPNGILFACGFSGKIFRSATGFDWTQTLQMGSKLSNQILSESGGTLIITGVSTVGGTSIEAKVLSSIRRRFSASMPVPSGAPLKSRPLPIP